MNKTTYEQQNNTLRQTLVAAFYEFLPKDAVLHQKDELKPYECDSLTAYTQLPLLVVSPTTEEEVQRIVALCYQHQVPIVPRGSGTGLSGGSTPHTGGVTLNFSRMNQILAIDPKDGTARVQPGVRNITISEQAAPFGLYFAPDPSSQIACSIGGNFAENSGGLHCLKYGLTINNVLGAKVVLPDGELIEIGQNCLQQSGYDLLAILIGSEGLLGVVTEITVKLIPKAFSEKVILAGFASVIEAANCVGAIISRGVIPAGLEMMDKEVINVVEDYAACGYPRAAEALIICEVDGCAEEVTEQVNLVQEIMQQHHATSLQVSQNATQRQQFWLGRKSAFPATGAISADYYCLDGTIPRRHIGKVLQQIKALSEAYGLRVVNVFHAGDGNLHPLILYDDSLTGELERCEELGGKILQACVDAGGTISGEHGVGLEKINQMCYQFRPPELAQFRTLKMAFDTKQIMNPEKHIPTLHRCAEFGAMHVHDHGKQNKHAHLPRY